VKQIRNLVADTEQEYEKEKLNERIARLSGGVAIIQVRTGRWVWVVSVCREEGGAVLTREVQPSGAKGSAASSESLVVGWALAGVCVVGEGGC
jgi:hypothetical protein